jgi:hypothetical protein
MSGTMPQFAERAQFGARLNSDSTSGAALVRAGHSIFSLSAYWPCDAAAPEG